MPFLADFLRDFAAFSSYAAWASLATLTALELVLGIDNIVFLSIVTGKLPEAQQPRVRTIGLSLALILRIVVLFGISWVMRMQEPLVTLPIVNRGLSGRDLILLAGGLFLMFKAVREINARVEAGASGAKPRRASASMIFAILQIMVIDVIFSLDSIVTAVGVADHLAVMVSAMVIAVLGMMVFAGPVGRFINSHPSMRILALAFLLLIGLLLVAEAFGQKIDRGYIYFAMGFAVLVELLNIRRRGTGSTPPTTQNA
jgi:predicted tellurium resistance membrane protein TerC